MIVLSDSIIMAAPSGSGIPLAAYMSMAFEAIPFDRQEVVTVKKIFNVFSQFSYRQNCSVYLIAL